VRENAGAARLVAPNSVIAGQRNDPIALLNGGQVGRSLVEASVLPRFLAALDPESFDQRGVVRGEKPYVRRHIGTEQIWPEGSLIRGAHEAVEGTSEDFSQDGLLHQVLSGNLREAAPQMRYPGRRCGYDRPITSAETPNTAVSSQPHVRGDG
jgi:hypothetical protein